jgi:hypothetical protein
MRWNGDNNNRSNTKYISRELHTTSNKVSYTLQGFSLANATKEKLAQHPQSQHKNKQKYHFTYCFGSWQYRRSNSSLEITTSRIATELHDKLTIQSEIFNGHGRPRTRSSIHRRRRLSPRRRPRAGSGGRRRGRRRCNPRRRGRPCGRCSTSWSSCGRGTRCPPSPPSTSPSSSPAASAAAPPSPPPAGAPTRPARRRTGWGPPSRSRTRSPARALPSAANLGRLRLPFLLTCFFFPFFRFLVSFLVSASVTTNFISHKPKQEIKIK